MCWSCTGMSHSVSMVVVQLACPDKRAIAGLNGVSTCVQCLSRVIGPWLVSSVSTTGHAFHEESTMAKIIALPGFCTIDRSKGLGWKPLVDLHGGDFDHLRIRVFAPRGQKPIQYNLRDGISSVNRLGEPDLP
jgi:hypothetical protein